MSHDVYLYSYPKEAVPVDVRVEWAMDRPVSHIDDVFGEVEDKVSVQEWWLKTAACSAALDLLTPKDSDGHYNGDSEFPIGKEQLITFRQNIIDLDWKDEEMSEWIIQRMDDLQKLIDTFDFENNYLTVHTD